MRIVSFSLKGKQTIQIGIVSKEGEIVPINGNALPLDMLGLIQAGPEAWQSVQKQTQIEKNRFAINEIELKAPLRPSSLRDFYAFEEHVATAHANRGKEVPKEWYEIPVFYFSNPKPIIGPGELVSRPAASQALDYELEVAAIIGKGGRDIQENLALEHIFGFTILNDWSARDIQKQEMKMGLGPAKGKDFASSLGPMIVTPDELSDFEEGRVGVYNLGMRARINGKEFSFGNWNSLHYSFGEMIARASKDVDLYPGEVIGSGTVGTGCLLELTKGQGPWLKDGDEVEMEIEEIGKLANKVG
jgi:fumarylacetoacetate (FAA) hydrolase